MAKLMIHDRLFEFEVIRRQRKSVEIQIDSISGFRVIAPKKLSEKKLLELLEPRKEWIYEKILEAEVYNQNRVRKLYENGETFMVLGAAYPLQIDICPGLKKAKAVLTAEHLLVKTSDPARDVVREAVVAFYRAFTRDEIEKRIDPLAERLGVKYQKIVIKDQKRRWGSCSHLGNLNFNWRCGMMPDFVLEYILIHEVCHLVHLNHSTTYWELVKKTCPEEAQARLWLKQNGITLDI